MIVVDTDIIASMTFHTAYSHRVSELHAQNPEWHAPILWRSEFHRIAFQYLRKSVITHQEALVAMDYAGRLISSREHRIAPTNIFALANTSVCSAYGCEFIALAKNLGTQLITYDHQLIQEFPSIAIKPEDYLAL